MPADIRVVLPQRPGTLWQALEAIAARGVNIEGFCADIRPGEKWGYLHFLVEDPAAARAGIESAGFEITSEHEVDVIEREDYPGALAEVAKEYRDAGRNIEVLYMASNSRIVIGTEDMQKERYGIRIGDAG